ncbi:hypothetical protein WJX74_003306 [Apatococcus lobatus]|uniref:UBC core domain-containing protein n=1 Tax=Apatococcus lobatus TaxID=904363 RepID=A0AAW1QJ59_9CHLO
MAERYNTRNPAIKRILQEMKEMQRSQSEDFAAAALEENLFEWNFAIRGAPGTEFEEGIYHGRIILPAEYPFKPPSFTLLTPNGRFERNTKICLSISSHHPEHWQPSWSIRTALTALIAFMPSPGHGAIGSLDYTPDERRDLAKKSQAAPPLFGSEQRQTLMQDLHQRMADALAKAKASSSSSTNDTANSSSMAAAAEAAEQASPSAAPSAAGDSTPELVAPQPARLGEHLTSGPAMDPIGLTQVGAAGGHGSLAGGQPPAREAAVSGSSSYSSAPAAELRQRPVRRQPSGAVGVIQEAGSIGGWEDKGLLLLAIIFSILIVAILLKKVLVFTVWDAPQSNNLRLSDLSK